MAPQELAKGPRSLHDYAFRKTKKGTRSRKSRKDYFDLLGLPTEIIVQILQFLPPPAKGIYRIENLNDINPCLALCSVSRFLKDCYTAYIGKLPTDIEITIRPDDYLVHGGIEEMQEKMNERLNALGPKGRSSISRITIIGPDLNMTTGDECLDKILDQVRKRQAIPKRLTPQHKVLLKEHIEEEIEEKKDIIQNLFECLNKWHYGIDVGDDNGNSNGKKDRITMMPEEIVLYPGQLPASAWVEVIKDYVLGNSLLFYFDFANHRNYVSHPAGGLMDFGSKWPYLEYLDKNGWLQAVEERPSNYPKSQVVHEHRWRQLEKLVFFYLDARSELCGLSFEDGEAAS